MTILEHSLGQVSPIPQASREILGAKIINTQNIINKTLDQMREKVAESKLKTEKIVLACEQSGDDDIISFAQLLRQSGDVSFISDYDNTPLTFMISKYRLKIIELILEHPNIRVNNEDGVWDTPLVLAAGMAQSRYMIKLLLEHPDILINKETSEGRTALTSAAGQGRLDNVIFLLRDPGMDLREHDQGLTALRTTPDQRICKAIEAKMREQGIEF